VCKTLNNTYIVLFDGECNLCNGAVAFIIRRDPKAIFKFAPLQSDAGRALLHTEPKPADLQDTIVLIENGHAYTRSTAALRIAKRLYRLWPVLYVFIIVPRPIRNYIYNWIARNRYAWFGRKESCMIPTPELKKRFLD
jgi:predicted DCC family thiol-disulfide oxidoreductase YuxK